MDGWVFKHYTKCFNPNVDFIIEFLGLDPQVVHLTLLYSHKWLWLCFYVSGYTNKVDVFNQIYSHI